jgi:hypothetical protein
VFSLRKSSPLLAAVAIMLHADMATKRNVAAAAREETMIRGVVSLVAAYE